jgi:chromosomal replication initiator protein
MISPEAVIKLVSKTLNVPIEHLKAKTRLRDITDKRQIAIYLIRKNCRQYSRVYGKLTPISYRAIGELFNRDHATAVNSVRQVNNMIATNKQFRDIINDLDVKIELNKTTQEFPVENLCPHCGQAVKEN